MKCKNCNDKEVVKYSKYSNGLFCSRKCARSYSTKNNRKEINKKISETLTGRGHDDVTKECKECGNSFIVKWNIRYRECCSGTCARKYRSKNDDVYNERISKSLKEHYKDPENRKRMRDIGRKGGFGKKGYINGIYFASSIEENCYEFLIDNNINFIPHKEVPNSSYVNDAYLIDYDLWIEIDGINREKKKEWLGKKYYYWLEKLEHYKKEKLEHIVIYNLDELKDLIARIV